MDLLNFESCELSESESDNGGRLNVVEIELLHNRGLCLCLTALTSANGCYNLVNYIDCARKTLQNMLSFECFFEVEFGSSYDDFLLEIYVFFENLL